MNYRRLQWEQLYWLNYQGGWGLQPLKHNIALAYSIQASRLPFINAQQSQLHGHWSTKESKPLDFSTSSAPGAWSHAKLQQRRWKSLLLCFQAFINSYQVPLGRFRIIPPWNSTLHWQKAMCLQYQQTFNLIKKKYYAHTLHHSRVSTTRPTPRNPTQFFMYCYKVTTSWAADIT